MDKFFGAFSLQNFLRQFFCGVVFFVPVYLYGSDSLEMWLRNGVNYADWSMPKVATVGVLACIIGTIIYHFEKNLYSYASQIIFENMSRRKKSWGEKYYFYSCLLIFVLFLLVFILTAVLGCCFNCSCSLAAVVAFAFILCLVYTIVVVVAGGHTGVISRTRNLWKLEAQRRPSCHACSKIDNWASFVHCGQSCCFAWLIGCAIVQDSSCYCCRVFSCGPDEGPLWQVTFVLLILMFEAFFDWHRYQHVLAITENNNK